MNGGGGNYSPGGGGGTSNNRGQNFGGNPGQRNSLDYMRAVSSSFGDQWYFWSAELILGAVAEFGHKIMLTFCVSLEKHVFLMCVLTISPTHIVISSYSLLCFMLYFS